MEKNFYLYKYVFKTINKNNYISVSCTIIIHLNKYHVQNAMAVTWKSIIQNEFDSLESLLYILT